MKFHEEVILLLQVELHPRGTGITSGNIIVLRLQSVDILRGHRKKNRPWRTYKYIRDRKYDRLIFSVML